MREQTSSDTIAGTAARHSSTRTLLASIGAIGSVLAASSCCLPILPFLLAAGFAGSSTFLSAARPYLLAASISFIAYGFYQARRAKKCRRRSNLIASILLWVAAVFVFMSIFFPQVMANASASLLTP
jgi:predicted PurR-regulated permease PerM